MSLRLKALKMKIADFANSVALGEVAHNEPPHLNPHCLAYSYLIPIYDKA